MELREFLNWAVGSVGSGVLAYLVIRYFKFTIMKDGKAVFTFDLEALSPLAKRRLGIFLPGGMALLAWLLSLWLGYYEMPVGRNGWFEAAFQIALAPIVATLMHGELELSRGGRSSPPTGA